MMRDWPLSGCRAVAARRRFEHRLGTLMLVSAAREGPFYVAAMSCGAFWKDWEMLKMKNDLGTSTIVPCCSHVARSFSQRMGAIENKGKFFGYHAT